MEDIFIVNYILSLFITIFIEKCFRIHFDLALIVDLHQNYVLIRDLSYRIIMFVTTNHKHKINSNNFKHEFNDIASVY